MLLRNNVSNLVSFQKQKYKDLGDTCCIDSWQYRLTEWSDPFNGRHLTRYKYINSDWHNYNILILKIILKYTIEFVIHETVGKLCAYGNLGNYVVLTYYFFVLSRLIIANDSVQQILKPRYEYVGTYLHRGTEEYSQ